MLLKLNWYKLKICDFMMLNIIYTYNNKDKRWNSSFLRLGRGKNGELLLNQYRVSVLQVVESSGDGGDDCAKSECT